MHRLYVNERSCTVAYYPVVAHPVALRRPSSHRPLAINGLYTIYRYTIAARPPPHAARHHRPTDYATVNAKAYVFVSVCTVAHQLRAAVYVEKGGTGKTTTTAHLLRALADEGYRVLGIDLAGKQGDLGRHFGVWDAVQADIEADGDWPNVATVFEDQWPQIADALEGRALDELVYATEEGVDLIPAHPGLDSLDADLGAIDDAHDRYSRLARFLDGYVPDAYDAVLLDLPGVGNNVSFNGLWAARNIVAPVEMGPFESGQAAALRGDVERINGLFDVPIRLALVLPTKVDTRTRLGGDYLEAFEAEYGGLMAPEYVPSSQDIRNAAEGGRTVFGLPSPSKTARDAMRAYRACALALLERLTEPEVVA